MSQNSPIMKKNIVTAVVVVALILAVLIGGYFIADTFLNKEEEVNIDDNFDKVEYRREEDINAVRTVEIENGDVEYLWEEDIYAVRTVEYKNGDVEYSIHVGENVTMEGYDSVIISRSKMIQAINKIAIIPVERFLDVKKADYSKYGLEGSDKQVVLTMADGRVRTLVIGNQVGVDNQYYAMDKENDKVCTLSLEYVNEFCRTPESFRSEIICTLSNVFVREITVHKGSTKVMTIVQGTEMGEYEMSYPKANGKVSSRKMNDLLSLFNQIDADAVVEENPADIAKYGFSNPLTVYIYDSAEKHTFKFGDKAPEGGVYIMYNDRPVVYRGSNFIYEEFKAVNPETYLEPVVN